MSLNDPQWGRGGGSGNGRPDGDDDRRRRPGAQDGPPDLDELWRDFNRRLNSLFGKGGGPRPPGGGGLKPDAKGAGIGVGLIAAVAVLIWLGTGFYIVPEGHRAVVLTFGRLSETTTRAGLHWRLPAPIQKHELVNVAEITRVEVGFRGTSGATRSEDVRREALMLTDDENIVDIQFVVSYRVRDENAADFLFNNRQPRDSVKQAAEAAMREVIASSTMDYILSEGAVGAVAPVPAAPPGAPPVPAPAPPRAAAPIETSDEQVRRIMQAILDRYRIGITITQVAIVQRRPPEQVQAAFEDVIRAGQDRERFINEGQAYANQVVPQARGTAARLLQEAEGYRSRVVEQAQGDAQRFRLIVNEYNRAPAVTRDRLYLETMQEIFSNTTKVMIDTRTANPMLFLPLEQILKAAGAEGAVVRPPAGSGPVETASPTTSDSRVRDGLRSRESR
jgi:membrane protease subunit HflK